MLDEESNPAVVGTRYGDESRFPIDVLVVGLYILFAPAADVMLSGSVSRVVLLGPMLLFVPGYVLLLTLFPTAPEPSRQSADRTLSATTVDGPERAALSVGVSVALLPIVGFVLTLLFGDLTLRLIPVLSAFSLVFLVVGAARRRTFPEHRRFAVPLSRWTDGVTNALSRPSRPTVLLNVLLGVCVVATVGLLAFGLVAPQSGTSTTNIAVGSGTGDDFTLSGYASPEPDTDDVEHTLYLENNEGQSLDYTVVVQLQRVSDGSVVESTEVDRFGVELDDGEYVYRTQSVIPSLDGDSLRIAYLVYLEEPPAEPDVDSAYRNTYVWIDGADGE